MGPRASEPPFSSSDRSHVGKCTVALRSLLRKLFFTAVFRRPAQFFARDTKSLDNVPGGVPTLQGDLTRHGKSLSLGAEARPGFNLTPPTDQIDMKTLHLKADGWLLESLVAVPSVLCGQTRRIIEYPLSQLTEIAVEEVGKHGAVRGVPRPFPLRQQRAEHLKPTRNNNYAAHQHV